MTKKKISLLDRLVEYILFNFRWVFILMILPVSLAYDFLIKAKRRLDLFVLKDPLKEHARKVCDIQRQVRLWKKRGLKTFMCTGRPGWQTMSSKTPLYKQSFYKVNVDLRNIIQVDTTQRTVRLEPLVTFGELSEALVNLGWTIPVLPELEDITIGGAIMGCGIETSSHKYGLFQHTCLTYELVLVDGSVVKCSKEENSDLFYAVPWSHGTIGFLVAVELPIIPAGRFVRLQYYPCRSQDEVINKLSEEASRDRNDFVEAIVYSPSAGVVMSGTMVNTAEPLLLNRLSRWFQPWFYTHVRQFLKRGDGVEYIPLRDYYHRHTKSLFWMMEDILPFGNNPMCRLLLGWALPPKVSLLKRTQGPVISRIYDRNMYIQDFLIPLRSLKGVMDQTDKCVKVYPQWLCPFKMLKAPGMIHSTRAGIEENMYVDLGLYGRPQVSEYDNEVHCRQMEEVIRNVDGFQMLYSDCYMSREEFRDMFDHSLYDAVRRRFNCQKAFPEAYDKVCRNARK